MPARVAVTGLGALTSLANNAEQSWAGIREGRSGIAPFTHIDASELPVRFGGTLHDFDASDCMSRREIRTLDPFIHYGVAAGLQAAADAGLEIDAFASDRSGVALGSGIGGLRTLEDTIVLAQKRGVRRISPYYIPSVIINMAAGMLAIKLGLRGPNFSVVSACATGAHNIGQAARIIQRGEADLMLAGGCEHCSCPTGIGGFATAKALSTRNEEPERASRPWDRGRDGFVLSDGAGVVVLEEYEHARRRGAHIHAELAGWAMNADAYHMTAPAQDGEGILQCMRKALQDARLNAEDINYINAHATSTPAGDLIESRAIWKLFSNNKRLAVSSTKSMLGHMLGAAGSVEAVLSILAMRDQLAPPTINLEDPEPEIPLNYVANASQELPIKAIMSNSFGFGGTNVSLIFRLP